MDGQSDLIPYSKNINGGSSDHNPAKKVHDFSHNHMKSKFKIRSENSYLGDETSKLIPHHSNQEKQTGNPKPAAIKINLVSHLPRSWLATDRRGKPGKSLVHFQAKPVGETHKIITKKRNLELEHDKGIKEPGKNPAKSGLEKQYFCSSCNKEFGSYYAFGGHRAFHVREERKWRRYSPSWAALFYRHPPPLPAVEIVRGYECWWCKKCFCSRQGLAAHSRFCYKKRGNMLTGDWRKAVVGRNFDLNELPPEAFLPEEILRHR